MRLNLNCVRDILICVEDNTGYRQPASFVDVDRFAKTSEMLGCEPPKIWTYQHELMKTYSNQELMYHFQYCINADLLEVDDHFGTQQFLVFDLTPQGHEVINNLRSPTVFEKTKKIAEDLRVHSLPAICNIASSVVSEIIKDHLT